MWILIWLAGGVIVGMLAKLTMPKAEAGGLIITVLLGIAGALAGGFLALVSGVSTSVDQFDAFSLILATAGATFFLGVYRSVTRGRGLPIS